MTGNAAKGKKFRNYVDCHCHIKSFDAASTPEQFAKRETELGTGYITCTDHGSLEGIREIYDLTNKIDDQTKQKKYNLKFIPGMEIYIRDDSDPFLLEAGAERDDDGTLKDYAKYFHQTLHFMDQKAFEAGSKLLSKAFDKAEKHGSEYKPIFNWGDIEELGSYNITGTSACLIGIVQRHLLDHNDPIMAERFYARARSMFAKGNFFVEVFPHICNQNWKSSVYVEFEDGTIQEFKDKNKLATDYSKINKNSGGIHAMELAKQFQVDPQKARLNHGELNARMINRKWVELPPKSIKNVWHKEGFLVNECTPYAPNGDVQLGANKFVVELAEKYGDPILISGDSHFAYPQEYQAQTIKLTSNGQNGWRFAQSHHRQDSEEAFSYFSSQMGISESTFEKWVDNGYSWASRFDNFKLDNPIQLPTKFYPTDTKSYLNELIQKHGKMHWDDARYTERLEREVKLFLENGSIDLLPYFFLCEDAIWQYTKAGELTGPGRGSAGGVLIAYLLGITHVDPIKYALSLDRFLTLDRILTGKYPDIDMDFNHDRIFADKDHPGKGWLYDKFGECVAQIKTETKMRLRQTTKDVFRAKYGKVPPEIEQLCKRLPIPPQGIEDIDFIFGFEDDDGNIIPGVIETDAAVKELSTKYKVEWEEIQMMLGLVRQAGRHPSGFIISNKPVYETVPTMRISGVRCTQYTPASVEASGLLKFDFLKVSKYNDIAQAIKLVQKHVFCKELTDPLEINGEQIPGHFIVPFGNNFYSVYNLPQDYKVFNSIIEGHVETVFQLDSHLMLGLLPNFDYKIGTAPDGTPIKALNSIEGLAALTALGRPGPLDFFVTDEKGNKHNMLIEYANRAKNQLAAERVKELDELLPETFGVLTFQENLTKVFKELGGTTGIEAENFRIHIGKKQMKKVMSDKSIFMKGAVPKIGEKQATLIWGMLLPFGNYGFCQAHAVEYMVTAYACAFLKFHYPLQWWTAVLQNAKRDKILEKFWPYCSSLIKIPDVTIAPENFEIIGDKIQAPLWLMNGIGDMASEQISKYAPYKDIEDFCQKMYQHQLDTGVFKDVVLKSGQKALVKKLGRSAVTSKVIASLIISGTMDGLFPQEQMIEIDGVQTAVGLNFEEKLEIYQKTKAAVEHKKFKGIKNKMVNLDDLVKFQYRKKIMPFYVEDLRKHMELCNAIQKKEIFQIRQGVPVYVRKDPTNKNVPETVFRLHSGRDIEFYSHPVNVTNTDESYTAFAYVTSQDFFPWDGSQACKLMLDIEGFQFEKVIWPTRSKTGGASTLGTYYTNKLEGCVVLAFFNRRAGKESLDLKSLFVVQDALTANTKENEEDDDN